MVEKPEDTVWIGLEYFCAEGDDFWNMSEEDCVKFATAELVKMGVISENEVLDSHREKVKKAYPAYFDTYKHFDTMIKFLDTFSNLYCVGAETVSIDIIIWIIQCSPPWKQPRL